jgi:hypothetical protein
MGRAQGPTNIQVHGLAPFAFTDGEDNVELGEIAVR